MLSLSEQEITRIQKSLMRQCEREVFTFLNHGKNLFNTLFPQAMMRPKGREQASEANAVLNFKLRQIKLWVHQTLSQAIAVSANQEGGGYSGEPIRLPLIVAKHLLSSLVHIFTTGRDFSEHDYYFIGDVTHALELDPSHALKIIEQAQYEIRRDFFDTLARELDEEQAFQCSVLLLMAIRADGVVHPAEFKYIENINQLLHHDQAKLMDIEKLVGQGEPLPRVFLPEDYMLYLYKYMVEIVMCDEEFDSQESAYIQEAGRSFGLDKAQQDEVIQPVAGALMIKSTLFPKGGHCKS